MLELMKINQIVAAEVNEAGFGHGNIAKEILVKEMKKNPKKRERKFQEIYLCAKIMKVWTALMMTISTMVPKNLLKNEMRIKNPPK